MTADCFKNNSIFGSASMSASLNKLLFQVSINDFSHGNTKYLQSKNDHNNLGIYQNASLKHKFINELHNRQSDYHLVSFARCRHFTARVFLSDYFNFVSPRRLSSKIIITETNRNCFPPPTTFSKKSNTDRDRYIGYVCQFAKKLKRICDINPSPR